MRYHVRAVDGNQQIRSLELDALDEADAMAQSKALELLPVSITAHKTFGRHLRPSFSVPLFAQELQVLLEAGLTVVESLQTLAEKNSGPTHGAVLTRLSEHLREGKRLSSALRQQPAIFPPLFVGVVQAAESTGDLPQSLLRYVEYETRLGLVRHQLVSAAIYPTILLAVGGGVSLFLLGYVVPRFSTVYEGAGREIPSASRLLLGWGQFASQHSTWLLPGFLLATAVVSWLVLRHLRRFGLSNSLGRLPGFRSRLHILEMSRLYLTLGMLLQGGIPVPTALQLSLVVVSDRSHPALTAVREAVMVGQPLSDSFHQYGLSTPVSARLLRAGEQSGQLGQMLARTAVLYEGETTRWLQRLTKTFEPALMVMIGAVTGLIVILLYMPVFDLAGSLP